MFWVDRSAMGKSCFWKFLCYGCFNIILCQSPHIILLFVTVGIFMPTCSSVVPVLSLPLLCSGAYINLPSPELFSPSSYLVVSLPICITSVNTTQVIDTCYCKNFCIAALHKPRKVSLWSIVAAIVLIFYMLWLPLVYLNSCTLKISCRIHVFLWSSR